jgi:hypothetical protein
MGTFLISWKEGQGSMDVGMGAHARPGSRTREVWFLRGG